MIDIQPSQEAINKLFEITNGLLGANNIKIILEFGSRYGEDSIAFAKKYPKASIYAFECNPNTLPDCKKNIAGYSNIILTEKAVSDKDGSISFYKIDPLRTETTWADGNQGASSLLIASGKYPIEKYVQEEIKVDSITLSTFIEENKLEYVDILWMDIQGAELLALKGLKNSISKIKIVHLEVEFFEIYKDQPLFDDISNFLTDKGFTLVGFSSYGKYAGDAIFINKEFASQKKINSYKEKLRPKTYSFFEKLLNRLNHILYKKP